MPSSHTNVNTLPPFWLKVKKDYVLDNFAELVDYLQKYPYIPSAPNPDYDDTLRCMAELSDDFAAELDRTPCFRPVSLSIPPEKAAALIGATVLATSKKGDNPAAPLLTLCTLLSALLQDLPQDTLAGIWRTASLAAAGRLVRRLQFSWRMLTMTDSLRILAEKVAATEFDPQPAQTSISYLEQHGLMMADTEGHIVLSQLNLNDFFSARTRPQITCGAGLTASGMAQVMVRHSDFEKYQSFDEAYNNAMSSMRMLPEFKPSPEKRLKEYSIGDTVPVRVVSKLGIKITVESIDRNYKPLKGNTYMRLDPDHRPSDEVIRNCIRPGHILEVIYRPSANCVFDLSPTLENHYRDLGCSLANFLLDAIYDSTYPGGTQWITDCGIRVGIPDSKMDELSYEDADYVDDAMENQMPVQIRTYADAPKRNGVNFYVYAQPEVDASRDMEPFGRTEADTFFAEDFINTCEERYSYLTAEDNPRMPLAVRSARQLARIIASVAPDISRNTRERLDNLVAAAIAAYITERKEDFTYLHHEIIYLSRLVAFAKGGEIRPIPYDVNDADRDESDSRNQMIKELGNYVSPSVDTSVSPQPFPEAHSSDGHIARVARLIEASNNLAGIIRPRELDNIKRTIAVTLGVDDEYKSILSDRQWYGDEDERLEFKLSVVYPPINRRRHNIVADPEGQKWAILKAICAFLNSTEGGTLLIGVNDYGFAEGIRPDIEELYRMKYISTPDADRYRQYVMRMVNNAFREQGSSNNSADIVSDCIRYEIEENPEGKLLLRIIVAPYPSEVVELQGEIPDDFATAYVRGSGRSEPVSTARAALIRRQKQDAAKKQ